MFRKILVSMDGSRLAEQVLPYVAEQALRFGSEVVLLQVIGTSFPVAPVAPEIPVLVPVGPGQFRDEEQARAYLERVGKSLQEKGLEVTFATVLGRSAGEAIVSYARENEVDLIAMLTHGRSRLKRLVLGSVAEYVLRHSELPILLIKPKTEDS